MLAQIRISTWSATRHDKGVTAEVARNHGSEERMGRYLKSLIDPAVMKPITEAVGVIRTAHYKRTLPWQDDGARILPAAAFNDYMAEYRSNKADFDRAVADFCRDYPLHVFNAKRQLNGLFDSNLYPAESEIVGKFSAEVSILPLPDSGDFRVALGNEVTAEIRRDIDAQATAAVNAAHKSLWERCRTVAQAMVDRLGVYDPDAPKKAPFRDSLVTNITELCDLLPSLNILHDPEMDRVRERMLRDLTGYEPKDLRENETARVTVRRAAEDILADMAAYCGGAA
jgi:hypothetical protein